MSREFSAHLATGLIPPDSFEGGTPVEGCRNCLNGLCSKHGYARCNFDRVARGDLRGATFILVERWSPDRDCTPQQARQALVNVLLRRSETQPRTSFELIVEEDELE